MIERCEMNIEKFISLSYKNEMSNFSPNDLDSFFIWAVENDISDITLQNEEKIFCEQYGRKHKVTKRKLNRSELIGIIHKIHSEGAVSKLNSGDEIDFAFVLKKDREISYRFRVNMKSIHTSGERGYSLAFRIIKNNPPSIDSLALPQDMLDTFKSRSGLILVTGPTGSGKSTLLASVLDWRLQDPTSHIKVSTYENPIEFVYDETVKPTSSISQMEVGLNIKTFADGVRNSLRTRSDVILIGEARDYETISATINGVMTGPLVYSTCHTGNASEVIARLINTFPENERKARMVDLITNFKMIVTQKLIPSLDGKRVAIREYLIFTKEIVDILLETEIEKITQVMRKVVSEYGQLFIEDLILKYNQGYISEETLESYRV
jgi:defect-in-organelle-trafficking protein DotB